MYGITFLNLNDDDYAERQRGADHCQDANASGATAWADRS
ncbi:hypothetical protein LTSEWAN_5695 [Salmonella enterica subsp. enterica serovar Wandsworth str. A4-580]|uniref:Uncharacterized protein n=1 Tax=Salmonella enterica subsp. enterica serovar Wandsworth str. A4-580 TaxID=913086 RepID=G5SIZ5_SALET|nr:hypothetical protein LTSEWAN_5695 [Salmonella enterica subsp. enterica serovar Wandsworth str. A4-580]